MAIYRFETPLSWTAYSDSYDLYPEQIISNVFAEF